MSASSPYGTNIAFIEELYDKYRENPLSVSASWREFFQDYEPEPGDEDGESGSDWAAQQEQLAQWMPEPAGAQAAAPAPVNAPAPAAKTEAPLPRPTAVPPPAPAPAAKPPAPPAEEKVTVPLRGAASKIVKNMEASLEVPTATSVRTIPVKVLEENRQVINHHLVQSGQNKASFTHMIAWAIVKALREFPRMNSSFAMQDGQPVRLDPPRVNFGIAIDVEKKDGTRSLLVPNIKKADALDFGQFMKQYNDLVRKARAGSLEIPDFEGTTISLTNPGTIGTNSSIPRLMQTQGTIVATGQIDYPPEYSATDPEVLAELGISKVMTMTSTYDHRIIQGAESGAFLARIHELILGEDNFYDDIFRDLRIPYEPLRWAPDKRTSLFAGAASNAALQREASVLQLINAYRVRGHLIADLDPLDYRVGAHPELNLNYYGLTIWDLDREFITGGLSGKPTARLREILEILRDTYCRKLGTEYMHIQSPAEKQWLRDRMEPGRNLEPLGGEVKRRILMKLTDAEVFEKFLHTKYIGHKRFSLEGAESVVPMVDHLLNRAAADGVQACIIGMAHRGRLNLLANILGKSYEKIFHEFEGDIDPATIQGSGDVKYHLGAEGEHVSPEGRKLALKLASNPSHLEAVDPIVEGMARAHQRLLGDRDRAKVIPLLLHGDAAFAGQGVVAETLNLSQLPGYTTGGTIHVVINNQIGFTTGPEEARSSVYATDVAKMVQAPIFHVNGDSPEACIRAIEIAYEFRQKFKKDVVIDMFCYRRHGHNEGDDPSFTQPRMYKLIKDHRSTRKLYTEALLRKGDLDPQEAESWLEKFQNSLQEAFDRTREAASPPPADRDPLWTDEEITGIQSAPSPDTGTTAEMLARIGRALTTLPEGFTPHPKLKPLLDRRRAMIEGTSPADWATAEQLAFGAIMLDGHRVRLSGQDSGRGTFSQRHAIFVDYATGREYLPLDALRESASSPGEAKPAHQALTEDPALGFSVYDSLLSEYGVMGFEYGYSVADPSTLVLWEAQFGDFMNGAQIIIDQFLSSAEEKWGQHSGLVLLLPHGFEGQGPEHSSARLERFLTLCAEGNMQVANVSTPAQYFHLLRRQMKLEPRTPLVLVTPKSLLRHPQAVSPVAELTSGRFEPVLDDPAYAAASRDSVTRLVFLSGKLYYDVLAAREKRGSDGVAVARLEQFYPWPKPMIADVIARYPALREIVWAQEEPANMGAWAFVSQRLPGVTNLPFRYVGRPISASPASGSHLRHEQQQHAIVEAILKTT